MECDPRIARFLSVDPLTKEYPMLTPYQFASNTPIWAIDLDGLEACESFANRRDEALLRGDINEKEFHKLNNAAGIAALAGLGGVAAFYVAAEIGFVGMQTAALKGLYWSANPVNYSTAASIGFFAAGVLNPDPNSGSYTPNPADDLGQVTRQIIKSIWRNLPGPTSRGNALEKVASRFKYIDWEWVGKLDNGWFPKIDFFKDGIGVQFKSFSGKEAVKSLQKPKIKAGRQVGLGL